MLLGRCKVWIGQHEHIFERIFNERVHGVLSKHAPCKRIYLTCRTIVDGYLSTHIIIIRRR